MAATNRFEGLLLNREQLAKPNSYFHEIRSAEATEVDTRLAAERKAAEEKAKVAAAAKAAAAKAAPAPSAEAPKPPPPAS